LLNFAYTETHAIFGMSFYFMFTSISHTFVGLSVIALVWWAGKMPSESHTLPTATAGKDTTLQGMAQLFAGLPITSQGFEAISQDAHTKKHYTEFEKGWNTLKTKRLDKIRRWKDQELSEWKTNSYNLFYPFSGPDFLNAFELFPNADNYIMFGLESVGSLPTKDQLKGWTLANYLAGIRQSLSEIFDRNYFITSRMSGALNGQVKGVLPIISVFLARTGNEIINVQKVYLRKDGVTIYKPFGDNSLQLFSGLHIIFKNPSREITQHLYYFSVDVSDGAIVNKTELLKFIKDTPNKATFVKSASYLLHTENFITIRKLITEESIAVLQDDTGVPYKYFPSKDWDLQLYGKYAKPIADFNYGYQPDLNKKFIEDATNVKPIDFTFGYHWWTDKSSILYFKRKK
jgi:hypothetical protein